MLSFAARSIFILTAAATAASWTTVSFAVKGYSTSEAGGVRLKAYEPNDAVDRFGR
jgi:hypothetical protein